MTFNQRIEQMIDGFCVGVGIGVGLYIMESVVGALY